MPNPNTIPYYRYQDIQIPDVPTRTQFQVAWSNNAYQQSLNIINEPELLDKAYLANTINTIINGVITIESYYNTDVTVFLSDLAQQWFSLVDNFVNKQNWIAGLQYVPYNFVIYNDFVYMCLSKPPIGTLPTNTTYWLELGLKGNVGAPGVDVNMKFEWSAFENYLPNDLVVYDGNIYVVLEANQGIQPDTDPTKWLLFLLFGNGEIIVGINPPNKFVNNSIWFKTETDVSTQSTTDPVIGEFLRYNDSLSVWERMNPNTVHTQIIGYENLSGSPVVENVTILATAWQNDSWSYQYYGIDENTIIDILPVDGYTAQQTNLYNDLSITVTQNTITLTKTDTQAIDLPIRIRIW